MNNPEKITANLVLAFFDAKRQNIEEEFRRVVSETRGRTFGEKLARWAAEKAGTESDPQVEIAVEMAISHFVSGSAIPTEDDVIAWIEQRGGMTGLRSDYITALDHSARG